MNKPQPRNSSTNNRALSTRIAKIEREITPTIQMTGMMTTTSGPSTTVPMRRKFRSTLTSSSATGENFTGSSLGLPDGARILNATFKLLNGRKLRVTANTDRLLIGTDTAAAKGNLTRENTAPYNRFPVVKVNIPDSVARCIDSADTTNVIFTVLGSALNSGTSYTVDVEITALWESNIY